MSADYGDNWAEGVYRGQAARHGWHDGPPPPQAPYPDVLREAPPEGSPGQVLDAWIEHDGRFPTPPGERERARNAQRQAIENGYRAYELEREITAMTAPDDRLDGEAAKRMLAATRHDDGSPVEDLTEMRSRVTELRPQWKQAGTSQVRTGPW